MSADGSPARLIAVAFLFALPPFSCLASAAGPPLGSRPYEMVWAGRTEDTRTPTVDFEQRDGWSVECRDAVARFESSQEQPLWGKRVGRLVYRGDGNQPEIVVRPPVSIAILHPWDCVNLWVYGNNWAWVPDRSTPPVALSLRFRKADGHIASLPLGAVRWKEWWLIHQRLSPEQIAQLRDATWEELVISGGRNTEDRVLYFDNLCFYQEPLPPLEFAPRPRRGVELPAGQTIGTNVGPGRLPFPNRPETILPDNLTAGFETSLQQEGEAYLFQYQGADGQLVYRYAPRTGTWSDLHVQWQQADRAVVFQPLFDGGARFHTADDASPALPESARLIDCRQEDDALVTRWECQGSGGRTEVAYRMRLWQKSLVIDVACRGGDVEQVAFGRAVGAENPRLITLPYLTGAEQRPAVLVMGPVDHPLFLMGLVDHTRSNASELFFANAIQQDGVRFNGGARYLPRTNGRRNDCFERIFLTVSPRFEEVLPNVPNPPSPWMHVAGERLWRAHGASNREQDDAFWKRIARYGMTKVVITDHETGWRDGGESFTFRTRAAPGKGGDPAQAEYARRLHQRGFRYGIYNNYTDFAPVNEHWHEDLVTRLPDGNWRTAWPRCYNPKPARAVEFEARLAPIIQEKFRLDTAYCDVHTAVRPWQYVDYDARVPGAGTFAATFYAYGEIMLHQRATWNGPVYSEGNNHWYYCGLTDGNYGQDQLARLDENPWLVDFDLRKLHPLGCNFGMGNPGMFFGRKQRLGDTPQEQEQRLSQFLAATLAFGHTGFLVTEGGMRNTLRSYFGLRAIHARYAQAEAAEIRYADEQGNLLDSTAAVASDAYQRSQIYTRYDNGVEVWVNGHPAESWTTPAATLPPHGWHARHGEDLVAFSALVGGRRVDYVESPEYAYADPRGEFVRLPAMACDGPLVALREEGGSTEVIPVAPCAQLAVALNGQTGQAVALDEAGQPIGPATTRWSRGMVFIEPVEGAFSYRVLPAGPPATVLRSPRSHVVPGERVTVTGATDHDFVVPADATPGELFWHPSAGGWIDFPVRPLAEAALRLDEEFQLDLTSRAPREAPAEVVFEGQRRSVPLVPGQKTTIRFPFTMPPREQVRPLPLEVRIESLAMQRQWWLKCEETVRTVARLTGEAATGQCFRGGNQTAVDAAAGTQAVWTEMSCDDQVRHGLFMHPPYRGGVGYAFAEFGPYELPDAFPVAFRCHIGKRDGSDPGDGILFRVAAIDAKGRETIVAERPWIEHAWTPVEADLDPWQGQTIRIKLIADVGPQDNSSGDWACWSDMRIESAGPVLSPSLHAEPVTLQHEDGPRPPPEFCVDDLRAAKRGVLHFQGIGLQSGGGYICHGRLNDIALGPLPAAGGVEGQGRWADAELTLPQEAIASLERDNRLIIENPGHDWFKVRRFWIELQTADDPCWSSQIHIPSYSQPPEWPHAEGTRVPFDRPIEIPLRFRPKP